MNNNLYTKFISIFKCAEGISFLPVNINKKKILWFFMLVIMNILIFLPIYFMFKYSISDRSSLITGGEAIPLWPNHPTLTTYRYILEYKDFYQAAANSFKVSILTIIISLILGVPAAYVLARRNVPGKAILLVGLISIRLFPDIVSIIPVAVAFAKLHLHDTYLGAALAHSLLAMPYVIYICMGVFESVPKDIEKQAEILGANKFTILFKIVLPVSATGLAAAAIYTFLLSWDEFIFSYFLLGLGDIQTLPLYLKQKMAYSPPRDIIMAVAMLLSLPVIIFTIILQKYMRSGYTAGAVK